MTRVSGITGMNRMTGMAAGITRVTEMTRV